MNDIKLSIALILTVLTLPVARWLGFNDWPTWVVWMPLIAIISFLIAAVTYIWVVLSWHDVKRWFMKLWGKS